MDLHNMTKQYVFVHVGSENITMGCLDLVQEDSNHIYICTRLGHPTIVLSIFT